MDEMQAEQQQLHHLHQQQLQRQVRNFWETQCKEIESTTTDFKNALPLRRIKKIMKTDGDAKMVALEAPVLLSKACEMFIMELTVRASVEVEMDTRKNLIKKRDIVSAISRNDMFDFLIDIFPRAETVEHEVCVGIPPMRGNVAEVDQNVPPLRTPHPNYYMPSPPPQYFGAAIPQKMVIERIPFDHPIYGQQPPHPYGLQVMSPAPKPLIMESSPDSDDQNKK